MWRAHSSARSFTRCGLLVARSRASRYGRQKPDHRVPTARFFPRTPASNHRRGSPCALRETTRSSRAPPCRREPAPAQNSCRAAAALWHRPRPRANVRRPVRESWGLNRSNVPDCASSSPRAAMPLGQRRISSVEMPPSCTHDLCSRSGGIRGCRCSPGRGRVNDFAEPGGAAGSFPSPRMICSSGSAPLSERNSTSVLSVAPMASSWSSSRPNSRSIRSTIAACTAIFAA